MKSIHHAYPVAANSHPVTESIGRRRVISASNVTMLWKAAVSMRNFFVCSLAVLSLAAAGSDGPWFPWPNIAGLFVLVIIVGIVNRVKRQPIT